MTKITFQDFYGQHVEVHNNTSSGNTRVAIKTMENLNDLHKTKKEDCSLKVDMALSGTQLDLLIAALTSIRENNERIV